MEKFATALTGCIDDYVARQKAKATQVYLDCKAGKISKEDAMKKILELCPIGRVK